MQWLLQQHCPLIVLACNTASAKALRTIQQNNLASLAPQARVLGVIRPTTEIIGAYSKSGHVGVLATSGTVASGSYVIEIEKFYPELQVTQEACPMWVPLVENGEHLGAGADYFVQKHINTLLDRDPLIDTMLLACTHYPLLQQKIKQFLPPQVALLSQGAIVAHSLQDYLQRHPEIENRLTKRGQRLFYTTDDVNDFNSKGSLFFGATVAAQHAAF